MSSEATSSPEEESGVDEETDEEAGETSSRESGGAPASGDSSGKEGRAQHPVVGALGGILRSSSAERRLLTALLVLASLYTVYFARGLLLPFILALLLSSLLQPLAGQLNRLRIPDGIAAIIVLLVLTVAVGIVIQQIAAPASNWFERRPYLAAQLNYKLRHLKHSLEEAKETTDKIGKIANLGEGESKDGEKVVVEEQSFSEKILSRARSAVMTFLVMFVLVYFLLSRGWSTLDRMSREMEEGGTGKMWADILIQIQLQVARYMFTVTAINVSLGIMTAVAMWLVGMPSPVLWGVVATILNFVPYLGGIITTLIIGTVSLLNFITWQEILVPPMLFILFNLLEGQFITPMVVGRQLELNPIAVVLSLLFWGWAWGIGGMLIAVPILAAIKIVSKNVPSMKTVRAMIG